MTEKQRERMYQRAEAKTAYWKSKSPGKSASAVSEYIRDTYCEGVRDAHNDATAIIEKLENALKQIEDVNFCDSEMDASEREKIAREALAELKKWRES